MSTPSINDCARSLPEDFDEDFGEDCVEGTDEYQHLTDEGEFPQDLDGGNDRWKLGRGSRNAALDWLIHGETGISSRAILETALTGKAPEKALPPLDPGDFRRCILMLERVPAARAGLRTLGEKSREWQMLGEGWDELARTLREEWGRELEARGEQNGAPRTREILLEICRGRKEA